ncbi:MAG: hypothetical protein RL301_93 [Actinomycetota bacterium]|jgi:rod shape-determining protein MreC
MAPSGGSRRRLLLVILIVTSLLLITLDLRGVQVVEGLKNGTGTALAPFQKVGRAIVVPVRNFFADLTHLGSTRSTINNLREENAKLRTQLRIKQNVIGESKQLKKALDLAGKARFAVVSAKVLAQGSSGSFTRTVTIDAGSSSGLKKNQTVINGYGLVGVIKKVFNDTALVMLISDPSFKIGTRIAGTQQIGILSGDGTNSGILQALDNREVINKGDVVLALGSANNSPFVPGVPIGVITRVSSATNSVSQVADVRYYTNLNALGIVSVVVGASKNNPRDSLVPPPPQPTPIPTVTVTATPSPTSTNN